MLLVRIVRKAGNLVLMLLDLKAGRWNEKYYRDWRSSKSDRRD